MTSIRGWWNNSNRAQGILGWGGIALIGVGLIATLIVLFYPIREVNGKLTFNTEQEYSLFKTWISQEGIQVDADDITALTSEPPIVVIFTARLNRDIEVSYGHIRGDIPWWSPLLIGGGTGVLLLSLSYGLYLLGAKEESQ